MNGLASKPLALVPLPDRPIWKGEKAFQSAWQGIQSNPSRNNG